MNKSRIIFIVVLVIIISAGAFFFSYYLTKKDKKTIVTFTGHTYESPLYQFRITYPTDFQVLHTRAPLNFISFGREEIFKQGEGYDGEFFISVFNQSETTVGDLIKDMGDQFGADRRERREQIVIGSTPALKAIVTTTTIPTWYYEAIFLERQGKIYEIHNGAMKNDLFSSFYNSFTFF